MLAPTPLFVSAVDVDAVEGKLGQGKLALDHRRVTIGCNQI